MTTAGTNLTIHYWDYEPNIVFAVVLRLCQGTTYRKHPHILSDRQRNEEKQVEGNDPGEK